MLQIGTLLISRDKYAYEVIRVENGPGAIDAPDHLVSVTLRTIQVPTPEPEPETPPAPPEVPPTDPPETESQEPAPASSPAPASG